MSSTTQVSFPISDLTLASLPNHSALTLLAIIVLLAMAALMTYPQAALRWMQRKRYQYEVTFSLYMMTPTEKFIFNSVLFLFIAMVSIAASLYLPEHVAKISRRAYYYASGSVQDDAALTDTTAMAVAQSAALATEKVAESFTGKAAATGAELAGRVGEGISRASTAAAMAATTMRRDGGEL